MVDTVYLVADQDNDYESEYGGMGVAIVHGVFVSLGKAEQVAAKHGSVVHTVKLDQDTYINLYL